MALALFLVQVCVLSVVGARWSSAAAHLLPWWHPRIGGSVPCFEPLPVPVWRIPSWRRLWWRCKTAVAGACGAVVDGARRWPRIGSGWCLGPGPGRRAFIVFRFCSLEQMVDAALQKSLDKEFLRFSGEGSRRLLPFVAGGGGGWPCWSSSSWKKGCRSSGVVVFSFSPSYCSFFVLVLCTMYVECG